MTHRHPTLAAPAETARVRQLRHGTCGDYDYAPLSGALESVTADDGTRTTWTHDGDLPLTETTSGVVSGRTEIAYDDDGRVTSPTINDTPAVTYDYDADGAPRRIGALTLTRSPTTGQLTATTLDALDDGTGLQRLRRARHAHRDARRLDGVQRAL